MPIHVGDIISIDGYRRDGKSRPVKVLEIEDDNIIHCLCLIRSTPAVPIERKFYLRQIDGYRPIVGFEPTSTNED